ncbi:MAG: ComEC family DNA internalization-related competence protein [Bacilli bacterium]|nr:ComEC family DNA internalization-related competence protein [Bacilli bacterium]
MSIIYNIIYVPFVSFILFPISIITFIIPLLDNILFSIINVFERISILLNNVKFLTISFSKIPIVLIIIYYLLLFNKKKCFVYMIIVFYLYNYFVFVPRVYFIDVGQGDSALIRYKNKNILIDTGGSYKYDYSDSYISMFKSLGVKKIDYMFISHGDLDHIGNSIEYIKKIKIDNIYINKYKKTKLEKELCRNKCKMLGDEDLIRIKDINFYILNPGFDMFDENDNSLVINFSIKNKNVLFMGDSSKEVEERIINDYDIGKVDILKVGHHGSNTSSSKEFINEINPKYSVISVGKNNRYGHPNKEVLDNLEDSKIYRTDEEGSIMFKIKNNKLQVETCSP